MSAHFVPPATQVRIDVPGVADHHALSPQQLPLFHATVARQTDQAAR
jgi:hypothetical protein